MNPWGDAAHPGGPGLSAPHQLQHHRVPWLLLPLPAWLLARGPGVPRGPHALGQAALSISAGRQTAVTGDRQHPPVTRAKPGARCAPGEQQSLVFPIRDQGAPIYSSTFPPVLPAPENSGIVGIWHPHGVCVSLTEQNHENQTRSQSDFRADTKNHPSRKAAGTRGSASQRHLGAGSSSTAPLDAP